MGSQPLPERVADLQACPPPKTVNQLRRFLGMLNFYRRFLPHAATIQTPLHDAISGPKVKGSRPVTWNDTLVAAFNEFKSSLSHATVLAHPDPTAPLALVRDASTTAMGAVLQQRVQDVWQLLQEVEPGTAKLQCLRPGASGHLRGCEVLPSHAGGPEFHHPDGPQTAHLRLPQKRDKCSPHQFNHLDFISQFTTDIRHISGQGNVVADAISRVEVITAPVTHEALAAAQENYDELQTLLVSTTAL